MNTEILLVFVLILKVAVCFELTETFGKQTIEDGPFGGEFNNCCYHCQLSQIRKRKKEMEEILGLTVVRFI